MKKFAVYIFILLLLGMLSLEVLIRAFDLAGHAVPEMNLNGDRLGSPNIGSVWVRGGVGEITSRYHINPQGWNSLRDYDADSVFLDSIKVALIGDSYIEGFHVDVDKSIGRILEGKSSSKLIVHEFGHSGGNIKDFSRIYKKFDLENYRLVFILITDDDLTGFHGSFMDQGDKIPRESLARFIYSSSAMLRYLNINHGMNRKFSELISSIRLLNNKKSEPEKKNIVNHNAIQEFGENTVFLFEEGGLTNEFKSQISHPLQEIMPINLPDDFGFDSHCNHNGRVNCALAMYDYMIEQKKN